MTLETGARSEGFAFEQGSTWGTAVAVGASDGVDIRSIAPGGGGKQPVPVTTLGSPNGSPPDIGPEVPWPITIEGDAYYGGNVPKFLSYIFGTSGAPSGTTTFTHTITYADNPADFATLVKGYRNSQIWHEWDSAMPNRLLLEGAGQGRVTYTYEWLGRVRTRSSSTNTTTQTDAVTTPNKRVAVFHGQGVFRINAQGGAALDSNDAVTISGFSIEIVRPHVADIFSGAAALAQPSTDGENVVTLTVDLPSYDVDTYNALIESASGGQPTEQKADLTFSSGYTPSTGTELTWTFSFPRISLQQLPPSDITGPERIPHRLAFKCLEASSAPTGMSGITKPVRWSALDEDSNAYLS